VKRGSKLVSSVFKSFIFLFIIPVLPRIGSEKNTFNIASNTDSNAQWQLAKIQPTYCYNTSENSLTIKLHNVEVSCCNDCDQHKQSNLVIGSYLNPEYFDQNKVPKKQFQPKGTSPICTIYKKK